MNDSILSAYDPSHQHRLLVGSLLGDVVHRLNNPLTLLRANLHYLGRALPGEGGDVEAWGEVAEVLTECEASVSELVCLTRTLSAWDQALEDATLVKAHDMWEVPMRLASIAGRYHGELSLAFEAPEAVTMTTRPAALYRALLGMLWVALARPVAHGPLALEVAVSPEEVRYVLRDCRDANVPAEGLIRTSAFLPEDVIRQAVACLDGRWEEAVLGSEFLTDTLVLPLG
jgi:hypothetical protein